MLNNEDKVGVTIHTIDQLLGNRDIIFQQEVNIETKTSRGLMIEIDNKVKS